MSLAPTTRLARLLGGSAVVLGVLSGLGTHPAAARTLACPSSMQCVAISGQRAMTFDPTAPDVPLSAPLEGTSELSAISCPSTSQCTAVDQAGTETSFTPGLPEPATFAPLDPTGGLWGLSCSSMSRCVVFDANDRAVSFDPLAPGAPVPMPTPIENSQLHWQVACPSASQCTAVEIDAGGYEVTFDPTGPSSAKPILVDPPVGFCGPHCNLDGITAISCPSRSRCIIGDHDGREVTFDPIAPGSPTPVQVSSDPVFFRGLVALACPSASQCTGVDGWGRESTFDPGAADAASEAILERETRLGEPDCPSTAQCTTIDMLGIALTFDPSAAGSITRRPVFGGSATVDPPAKGVAQAGPSARVRDGAASVSLTCDGAGPCAGTLRLVARVNRRAAVRQHGRRRLVTRIHPVAIGAKPFSLAEGSATIVRLQLSRRGRSLVRQAGARGLTVKAGGLGMRTRSVVLKPARR